MSFSPNNDMLVTASNNIAFVYKLSDGELIHKIEHVEIVYYVSFSSNDHGSVYDPWHMLTENAYINTRTRLATMLAELDLVSWHFVCLSSS